MKRYNLLLAVTSLFILFACEETATRDVSDTDSYGEFSITVDGTNYQGETVVNGAVIGVRSISAETEGFYFSCFIEEASYTKGAIFSIGNEESQIMPYLLIGDNDEAEVMFLSSGTITVVDKTRIEIDGTIWDFATDSHPTITGYISSK